MSTLLANLTVLKLAITAITAVSSLAWCVVVAVREAASRVVVVVATTRAVVVVATTATATSPSSEIGSVDAGLGGDPCFGCEEEGKELTEADGLVGDGAGGDGGDEPVVLRLVHQPLENMRDDVIFIQRLPGCCQFVGEALHLGEVGGGRGVTLAGTPNQRSELDDARP